MTVPPLPRTERDPARLTDVAALFALIVAAAHVPASPHHMQEMPYVGAGFVAVVLACLIGATGIVVKNALWAWALSGLTCFASIAAWVVSRTAGLPGMDGHDVGNWGEPLALVAVATEVVVVTLAAYVIVTRRKSAVRESDDPAPESEAGSSDLSRRAGRRREMAESRKGLFRKGSVRASSSG